MKGLRISYYRPTSIFMVTRPFLIIKYDIIPAAGERSICNHLPMASGT